MMTKTQGKKVMNIGYWIASVFIAIGTAVFLILGIGFSPVLSNSMAPTYPAGSVVMTVQVPTNELSVGDVARLPMPESDGINYIHRIVEATPQGELTTVKTKGDQNPDLDSWSVNIVSDRTPVVFGAIPMIGNLTAVTSSLWAQILLLFLVVGFIGLALFRVFIPMLRKSQSGRHADGGSE